MLAHILIFLLNATSVFLIDLLILRAWMIAVTLTVSSQHSIQYFVLKFTDKLFLIWKPISYATSRLLPAISNKMRSVLASLLYAWFIAAIYSIASLWLFYGNFPHVPLPEIAGGSLLVMCKWFIGLLNWIILAFIILSWTNPQTSTLIAVHRLIFPFLHPIQKILSKLKIRNFDFSPILLLFINKIILIILLHLSASIPS